MARPGQSAWLLLASVLLFAASASGQSQDCSSATFQLGRTFQQCNNMAVLGASLHWTYHAANGSADIAFRAPQNSNGWVAWGINTQGQGMPGSSVFVASQDSTGAVSVLTTVLESTSPSLTNQTLRFDVPVSPTAEYVSGVYAIFATVKLPNNSTTQNTVWQAGPGSTGAIAAHQLSGANLQSTRSLDFLSGQSTGGGSKSRLHRRNIHGILNGVSWGILIPLGAMIARYLRVFEAADPAWFYLHITCQLSGYILGVAGWALGLKLGSESKGITYKPHRNIGIAIFCLATLQVFALLLRPDKKNKYRFYWNIYHHSVGYSAIVLSAINIFKGLDILKPASGWKTSYIVILGTLGGVALFLEVITWAVVLRRRKSDKSHGAANGAGWQHQQGA